MPSRGNQPTTGRYGKAAELALEQLDWCIDYLHRLRKHRIAEVLHRNRNAIAKRYHL